MEDSLRKQKDLARDFTRYREIACAIIIDTHGRFLLQRRDNIRGILHPGKVSLFGGHREGGETYLECAVRELHEEISYLVSPERFEYLTDLDGLDKDIEAGTVRGNIFVVRDIPVDELIVLEGSLMVVDTEKLIDIDQEFTPSARFAIKTFLDLQCARGKDNGLSEARG